MQWETEKEIQKWRNRVEARKVSRYRVEARKMSRFKNSFSEPRNSPGGFTHGKENAGSSAWQMTSWGILGKFLNTLCPGFLVWKMGMITLSF